MLLRHKAADDPGLRRELMAASRTSFLFWINAFVWTYRQNRVLPNGTQIPITGLEANAPFITWPIQDEVCTAALEAIATGEDINFEKSRDMGASWLLLAIADWFFLWTKNVNIGAVSRKETLVDNAGDMDSLFEKIRYIHQMLPPWQLPAISGRFMFFKNLELNSTITGESTNADVGRGGRKTFYIVDEAAAITNGEAVEHSLSQNTPCQIWASTPHGPNTQFHKRIKEGRGVLIQMPWYRHPEKAFDAHQVLDEFGHIKWTSSWYRNMERKYSRKTLAQEVDMDHGQAGDMFFDHTEIERHRRDHETAAVVRGSLLWITDLSQQAKISTIQAQDHSQLMFINASTGAWRFWFRLVEGRPPQFWTYVFGIDISHGAGASNSVISVLACEINQIVAKMWDAYISPEELAILACAAGIWFGGLKTPAFMCWENNGPGSTFGRKVVDIGYPMFYRQRIENTTRNKRTPRWGWNSNAQRKEIMLGRLRDSLNTDEIIVPCTESLDEYGDYIYGPNGTPMPSVLRDEVSGGRELHGDHAIADGLTLLARDEMPRGTKPGAIKPPRGTYAWRKEQGKRKKRRRDPWLDS